MPMPVLDPGRFFEVALADPAHRLPLPGRRRDLMPDGEVVDAHDPFFAMLLADGSLKRKPAPVVVTDESAPDADVAATEPQA